LQLSHVFLNGLGLDKNYAVIFSLYKTKTYVRKQTL